MSITTRTIRVGDHRIFVREAGEGPLVLLLHGFPETSYSWRNQLPVLADAGYHAVAIDGLGYGRSSKPPHIHDYRITELVAVTAGTVSALGAQTASMIGHDWGALVAWTAAWTRPDVFTAVGGLAVPFGGRGLMAMPGSPFGEQRPSVVHRRMAGPDLLFYAEYFDLVGQAEAEFEADVAGWLRDQYYSSSASIHPPGTPPVDIDGLDDAAMVAFARRRVCLKPGARLRDDFATPDVLPEWLRQEDLDHEVAEFERTGIRAALNWYRCFELNWELLGAYEGRPVEVPALFVVSDRDLAYVWSREAIDRMREMVPDLRGQVILRNCGHWMQQEAPDRLNPALVAFLDDVHGGAR